MYTDFRDFWCTTLQLNATHIMAILLCYTRHVHFLPGPGDVMLTSMKSCRSPTKINISLKFCVKKNVTATVNLFVNFRTKSGVVVVETT